MANAVSKMSHSALIICSDALNKRDACLHIIKELYYVR